MIGIEFFINTLLGYMFLSSSLIKLFDMQSHYLSVSAYQIVPERYTFSFSIMDAIYELIIAVCLIFGVFLELTLINGALLLSVYTVAIAVNLRRGRTDLDCGCGGLVGNHKISPKLIWRNVSLIVIILILAFRAMQTPVTYDFDLTFWLIQSLTIIGLVSFLISIETISLAFKVKKLRGENYG
ncbi:MauE/DoxX family redox-associated membrane protein [Cytobacillus sp. Hm23]